MEKAPNAWHRQGTQKTGNIYSQPKRPSTAATHSIITHAQLGHHQILAANAARCEAQAG